MLCFIFAVLLVHKCIQILSLGMVEAESGWIMLSARDQNRLLLIVHTMDGVHMTVTTVKMWEYFVHL